MNRTAAWLMAAALTMSAQGQERISRPLGHGVGVLESGVTLRYRTMLEPAAGNSTARGLGGDVVRALGRSMQHCLYDRVAMHYFGYGMTVSAGPTADTRTVVFEPVDISLILEALKAVAGDLPLNPAPMPKFPPPQTVRSGDTIAMDLMTSVDGKERIADYIEFSFGRTAPRPPKADTATPQDFTIDDLAPRLELGQAEVKVDGKKFDGVVAYSPKEGRTLWVYFPGQGRYVLSLSPRHRLTKAGVVRGRTISFSSDGHEYEIKLLEPLAGEEKAWNLYVMRDAGYLPRSTLLNRVVMSADRLENLIGR